MIQCKNCETEFQGKFCPKCGQKAKTGRISFVQVLKDLQNQVIHIEEGFLYTIRALFFQPGQMVKGYLAGRRVQHVKPVKFLVWTTVISFLVIHVMGFQDRVLNQIKQQQNLQDNSASLHLAQKINDWINAHPSVLMLFTVPLIAFASWLLFRKRGYNYAEHFTGSAYLMGMLNFFNVFFTLFMVCFSHLPLSTLMMIGSLQWIFYMVYFGWAYRQWFPEGNRGWVSIKAALVVILGYALLIIGIALISSTILTFFKPQVDAWLSQ
ncbi:MAG TPA: DUF3667 domain-containing protein [Saprospiraceae bacterium]|nr:DUF3667 domain-containing protein [Saprospiraceae bacterium]